jgi:hypothetical protein
MGYYHGPTAKEPSTKSSAWNLCLSKVKAKRLFGFGFIAFVFYNALYIVFKV